MKTALAHMHHVKPTMPASTGLPFSNARSVAGLSTPFWRLSTTASGGVCAAISRAISSVAPLFTVTSTSLISRSTAGSAVTERRAAGNCSSSPLKSVRCRPWDCSSSTMRARPRKLTRRPARDNRPPTKQPIVPAPATTIRASSGRSGRAAPITPPPLRLPPGDPAGEEAAAEMYPQARDSHVCRRRRTRRPRLPHRHSPSGSPSAEHRREDRSSLKPPSVLRDPETDGGSAAPRRGPAT